jgi:hypothetical protein
MFIAGGPASALAPSHLGLQRLPTLLIAAPPRPNRLRSAALRRREKFLDRSVAAARRFFRNQLGPDPVPEVLRESAACPPQSSELESIMRRSQRRALLAGLVLGLRLASALSAHGRD